MKKVMFLMLAVLFSVIASPAAAQSLAWNKFFIGENGGVRTAVVTENNAIYVFGYDAGYKVSFDAGQSWSQEIIPFEVGYVEEAVEADGKIYLAATGGLFSYDGSSWQQEKTGAFFALTAANGILFASGYEAYKFDGSWSELTQLESFLASDYSFFASMAVSGDLVVAFINEGSISSQTTPVVSYDGGATWQSEAPLAISVATDAAADGTNYSVVGINPNATGELSSGGQYQFDLDCGTLYAAAYFDGSYWTAGYYGSGWPSDPGALGIIMPNGDISAAFIADAPIEELTTNGRLLVAVDRSGGVYVAVETMAVSTSTAVPESAFTVYPNPTAGRIYFSLPASETVKVLNLSGSLLKEQKMPAGKNSSDLSAYPPGMYIIQAGNGIKTKVVRR